MRERAPSGWIPFGRVAVVGPSMVPAFRHGDRLFVRWRTRIRTGDVVVARHPGEPDLFIVKRVVRRESGGWWLASDNPAANSGSWKFGPVPEPLVLGRVLFRYWPLPCCRPHRLGGDATIIEIR